MKLQIKFCSGTKGNEKRDLVIVRDKTFESKFFFNFCYVALQDKEWSFTSPPFLSTSNVFVQKMYALNLFSPI